MGTPSDNSKHQQLARRRTVHPRPEHVSDPLFHGDPFFDRHDAVQVKYEMLRSVRVESRSVSRAAAAFGLSRPTYYEALAAFERAGMLGLLPAKKGPRRAHKLSQTVLCFIDEQLQAQPTLSAAVLAARVQSHLAVTVHPRSIGRAIERHSKKNA